MKVKFLARTAANQDPALWLSLFHERRPIIQDYEFIFDPEARDYDWLVVYEGLPLLPNDKKSHRVERLSCSRDNTLFITTEPSSVKIYGPEFLGQFGHVLTTQTKPIVKHPGQIFHTPPLRWYYGRPMSSDGGASRSSDGHYIDLDEYMATEPWNKTKDLSVVCSSKQMSPALKARYEFTSHLSDVLKDNIDWFGWGVRPMHDKAEAMDPYRYHIAIENHVQNDHWTEKISDCFLAYCLPFYHGAPNLSEYFPQESFIPIDIFDIKSSTRCIVDAIRNGEYEKRLVSIKKARELTLTKFNIMNTVAKLIDQHHSHTKVAKNAKIYGRHAFRKAHPIKAMRDVIHRAKHGSRK